MSLTRSFNYGMEGLRQGGHSFFVTESGTITGNFFPDIGTPSGQAVDWQEASQGTDTYTFWDDGFDAQLFGMCVVLYTTSGSRDFGLTSGSFSPILRSLALPQDDRKKGLRMTARGTLRMTERGARPQDDRKRVCTTLTPWGEGAGVLSGAQSPTAHRSSRSWIN